jgi:hypothetical protein
MEIADINATAAEAIFTKLTLVLLSAKSSSAEFHENLTNGLLADTESQTDGRCLHTSVTFFTSK